MARVPIGERIKEQRRRRGMKQGDLAALLSISPGYLSLIENNKRLIGGKLLRRCAEALDVDIDLLTAYRDDRLAADLCELARNLDLTGLDDGSAARFVAHAPEWARAFVRVSRLLRDTTDKALVLAERLKRDPELGEITHQILSQITSIKSFAEILTDYENLSLAEQRRFAAIVAEESHRLTASAHALMAVIETDAGTIGAATPEREVDDFIIDHRNHFAPLEDAAERLGNALCTPGGDLAAAIVDRLASRHGIAVRREQPEAANSDAAKTIGDVVLPAIGAASSERFLLARRLAELELAEAIAEVARDERLTSEAARMKARSALGRYCAGALLLPYDRFLDAAQASRYDIDRLGHRFRASFEQVAHRLVTLRRPGAEGVAFAFLRTDPAGNISKRFSLPELTMPRYGSACPLWIVYAAFAAPGRILSQMLETPGGERFLLFARHVTKTPALGAPAPQFSVMLGCMERDAGRVVYGDAYSGGHQSLLTAGGFECRACTRVGCAQRAHDPVIDLVHTGAGRDPERTAAGSRRLPGATWKDAAE